MVGAVQRLAAIEDEWSRRATHEAISAARAVIADGKHDGTINGRTKVSDLSEVEWGWIVCSAIFAWIKTKGEQAVAEGTGYEEKIRFMPRDPQPWETGAVEAMLPSLAELKGVPFEKPFGEWDKDEVISFALQLYTLLNQSLSNQYAGSADKITQFSKEREERELMARNGGPLASRDEMEDEVPF